MEYIKEITIGVLAIASTIVTNNSNSSVYKNTVNQQAHEKFHYPKPLDLNENTKATPYLFFPFKKSDLEKNPLNKDNPYKITESWIYSDEELSIHKGDPLHGGVDIYVPYGTPVVSPVDGYATSSYNTYWKKDENGEIINYNGKPIRMGLGYFVYIYVPSVNRFVELAHLSEIDPAIPFIAPEKTEAGFQPFNSTIKIDEIKNNPNFVHITKGSPIGRVGYSGLAWGENLDYKESQDRSITVKESEFNSWDEPHVHFEEFWINQETGEKGWQRDPYAIYNTAEHYPTQARFTKMGKDPLWIIGEDELPEFAG